MFLRPLSIIVSTLCITYARVYERCELVRELRNFDIPEDEIPTWVCIAHHESDFNTSAMNPGSGDHGLFQISQIYWCSPPGSGYGCNSPCSKFRDDDIADDLQCIRRIHNEHRRISGDGFNAWVVYPLYCKNDNYQYVAGCSDQELPITPDIPVNATENEIPYEEVDEYGDGYHFPPLPNFSKIEQEDNLSKSFDSNHGYEFPNFPFARTSIHDSVSVKDNGFNFPEFPHSKQSIHEFISVHTPTERTIIKASNQAKQDENELPIKPAVSGKDNEFNFPEFPYSKQSIHEFISVHTPPERTIIKASNQAKQDENDLPIKPAVSGKDNGFNFPEFPYSKQSIHEFISVHTPPERTIIKASNQAEQDEIGLPIKPVSPTHSQHNFTSGHSPLEDVIKTSDKTEQNEIGLPMKPVYSADSLHGFISEHSPPEKVIKTSNKADQDEIGLPVKPVYSKNSIHDFISVHSAPEKVIETSNKAEQDEIGLLMIPVYSTHSLHSSPEKTLIKTTFKNEQDENNFPIKPIYSKHSISHFVPVSTTSKEQLLNESKKSHDRESEYNFPPLPKSSEKPFEHFSTHDSSPAKKTSTNPILSTLDTVKLSTFKIAIPTTAKPRLFVSPVYSTDYHNSVSVSTSEEPAQNMKSDKEDVEYIFPSLPKVSESTLIGSNPIPSHQINMPHKIATERSNSGFSSQYTISSAKYKKIHTSNAVTVKPPIRPSQSSSEITTPISTVKLPISTTESLSEVNLSYESKGKTATIIHNYYTKHPSFTTNLKSSGTSTKLYSTTKKPTIFTLKTSPKLDFATSSSKPATNFQQSYVTKSRSLTSTTQTSFIKENSEDHDLQGASSTLTPFIVGLRPGTTTLKSFLTNKSSTTTPKSPKSLKTAFEPFKSQTTTQKLPLTFKRFTTTTSKPQTSLNKAVEPFKSQTSTLKPFTTIPTKPPTVLNTAFVPLKSQTTTQNPLLTFQHFSTTTSKPQTSLNKAVEPFKSQTTTLKPFTTIPTKPPTVLNTAFVPFKSQTTTQNPLLTFKHFSTTTSKPQTSLNKAVEPFKSQATTRKSFTTIPTKPPTVLNTAFVPLKSQTTTQNPLLTFKHFSTTTSKPQTSLNKAVEPFKSQATTRKSFTTIPTKPPTVLNTAFVPFKSQTTTQNPLLTFKHFRTTTSKPQISLNKSVQPFKSQTTTRKPFTTILNTVSVPFKSQTTTQNPLFTFKHFTTTSIPKTSSNTAAVPFKSQTTTRKPLFTFKPTASEPKTKQISVVPSAAQKSSVMITNKPVTSPIKLKILSSKNPFTSLTTLSNVPYKSSTTPVPQQLYRTTSNPLSKQLTFAPDSFFSWIFGSQTLPPIVPPARPPRPTRPQGERPGGPPSPMNQRPRPGGLPRPPRPGRPGTLDGLSGTQEVVDQGPEFGMSVTRRPLGNNRPPRPFQRRTESISPFTRSMPSSVSLAPFTTSIFKMSTVTEAVPSQKPVASSDTSRQISGNVYPTNSSETSKISKIFRQSKFEPRIDEHAVEVKVDDNFTFLRTKFGYRLFRSNKT